VPSSSGQAGVTINLFHRGGGSRSRFAREHHEGQISWRSPKHRVRTAVGRRILPWSPGAQQMPPVPPGTAGPSRLGSSVPTLYRRRRAPAIARRDLAAMCGFGRQPPGNQQSSPIPSCHLAVERCRLTWAQFPPRGRRWRRSSGATGRTAPPLGDIVCPEEISTVPAFPSPGRLRKTAGRPGRPNLPGGSTLIAHVRAKKRTRFRAHSLENAGRRVLGAGRARRWSGRFGRRGKAGAATPGLLGLVQVLGQRRDPLLRRRPRAISSAVGPGYDLGHHELSGCLCAQDQRQQ